MYHATPESATHPARTVIDTAEWLAAREGWPTLAAREAANAVLIGRAREIATKISNDRVPTWLRVYIELYGDVIAHRLVLAQSGALRLPALQTMCQDAARFAVHERNEGLERAAREAYADEQDDDNGLDLEAHCAHLMAETRGAA